MNSREIDEFDLATEYTDEITDIEAYLDEYYSSMPVSDDQKEKRKKVARDLRDALIFLFLLMRTSVENGYWEYDFLLLQFRTEFRNAVQKYARLDSYINNYIDSITQETLDTTIRHLGIGDAGYYLSGDRATAIAANESLSIVNYEELQEAIDDGYTMKMWVTQRDSRVRRTHSAVDGVRIPIEDMFAVGEGLMYAPHDYENNPEECPNCRCALRFSR